MGCSPATGEIPETPIQETIFALDDAGNILLDENDIEVGIEKINAEFNYTEKGKITRYFYKKIKVNDKIYTADVSSNIELGTFEAEEYFLKKNTNNTTFIDFIDFYKGISNIIYYDEDLTISFSDLYEEVVQ